VAGMYFYRNLRRFVTTDYTDRSQADYTAVPVVSPLNGEVFNVYNLAASKVPLTNRVDRIAFDDLRYTNYRGIEFSFRYRLPKGGSVFGGTSTGRTLAVTCDQPDNPNLLRFCDQTVDGVSPPIQTSFKLAANYPLPQGVRFGVSYVRQPGGSMSTNWLITRNTRYPNTPCSAPCVPNGLVVPGLSEASVTMPLKPTGVDRLGTINNLDLRFGRNFNLGRLTLEGLAEVYNVLNQSTPLSVRSSNFGTATFWIPGGSGDVGTRGAIPYARFFKLGIQARW
jgi:hypothetical protein